MRTLLCFMLFLLATGLSLCWAQTTDLQNSNASQSSATEEIIPPAQPANRQLQMVPRISTPEAPKWHFELGGSFAGLTNGYGRWYSGDAKISYSGSKYFTPMLSFGSQTRPEGTQQAYGLGSYVNLGKYAYAIAGIGVAPDRGVILYPNFRFDVMGVVRIPPIKGLLITGGYSSYRMGGGSAKIASLGSIYYYRKLILDGGVSFSRSYPGSLPSKSAHLSFMTGHQRKYWLGAGVSGGNLHYQLMGIIPYDVRLNGYGFSAFYQKWLGSNWGVTSRYYFTHLITAYTSNSFGISLFCDF